MRRIPLFLVFALAAGLACADPRPFQLGIGAGMGYYGYANDVESSLSAGLEDQQGAYSFWGGNLFLDISDYFTLSTGVWSGLGKANTSLHTPTSDTSPTPTNTVLLMDVGAVLKGPMTAGTFTFSPKVGFSDVLYLSGGLGGTTPNSAGKQLLSPFSLLIGADTDYVFPSGLFIRLPLDVRFALNSRPKGSAYSGSYVSSSGLGFSTGLSIGYQFLNQENDAAPAPSTASAESDAPNPAKP